MSIYLAPRKATPVPVDAALLAAYKASPLGPGAGVLQTEFPLSSIAGQQTAQRKMQRAWQLGIEVPWIRAAERAIGGKVQSLAWHLEDADGETIDDAATDATAQEAQRLIEKPQADLGLQNIMFRSDLWRLTMRHVGLCGNAFWYLDQLNLYGLPKGVLYLRPDRMTPQEDAAGNLLGWWIDKTPQNPGIAVRLDEIIHFVLDPPDIGHFGIGLVESALLKLSLSTALDQHLSLVLSGGGRLSGLLSPKTGVIDGDTMLQMERDWRTVVEQADAAKRLQLIRAPVDFQKTTLTPAELQIRELMTGARDDLLGLWGVPVSKLGIHDRGRGLGSSQVTNNDDETLWADAVTPRLTPFRELLQYRLVDPWASLGATLSLILDIPTFDDDAPRYDAGQKSVSLPLTVNQRLEILGMDPIDEKVIGPSGGPLGSEIILPATSVLYANATTGAPETPTPAATAAMAPSAVDEGSDSPAGAAAGETATPSETVKKAAIHPRVAPLHASLVKLRTNLDARVTPRLKRAVGAFLGEQQAEIAAQVRKHAEHIAAKPRDTSIWWDGAKWDKRLRSTLSGHLAGVAETVSEHIGSVLTPEQKASPVVERVLTRGAARITRINTTTRDLIASIIATAVEDQVSLLDVADAIEEEAAFDDYRAEMIARTELMDAYNAAALGSYGDAGISDVQAIDGTGDEECAARDGQTFSLDEADTIEDHPNGTLDWVPVFAQEAA